MAREDRSQEILQRKQRASRQHGFFSYEIDSLQRRWSKTRDSADTTPDFFVVRLVTVMEVFARRNIAELIDHAKDYTDRAVELSKHFKLDFALVRDIQGRAITLGDIVGHNVPLNSFAQLLACFETLIGKPLRPTLSTVVDRRAVEVEKRPSEPIISDFDSVAKCLTRLFEVRHILVHELPTSAVYDKDEIDQFFAAALRFSKALEQVLTTEKFGMVPLTQTDMNIAAGESLRRAEEELDRLVSDIRRRVGETDQTLSESNRTGEWLESFNDAQQKWLSYRNAHCEFQTFLNKGGTIRPLLWATEAERLTTARIADLQAWLEQDAER